MIDDPAGTLRGHVPANSLARPRPLTEAEQASLLRRLRRAGGSHRERSLVRARLVSGSYSIVLRCLHGLGSHHRFAELAQEGVLALVRAIDAFAAREQADFTRFVAVRVTRWLRRISRRWARERRDIVANPDDLSDPAFEDPLMLVEQTEAEQKLDAMLEGLPELQRRVIRLRFGIGVREATSREAISKELRLPQQRVRYLEERALCTLRRRASRTKALARGPDDVLFGS